MKAASLPDRVAVPPLVSLALPVRAAIRRARGRHLAIVDGIGLTAATWLALTISSGSTVGPAEAWRFLPAAAIPIAVRMAVNVWLGLYSRLWVHASVPDLLEILRAAALGSLIAVSLVSLLHLLSLLPSAELLLPSFWFLELILAVAVLGGTRFAIRAVNEIAIGRASSDGNARVPALL